jgi:hypothetical protein
VDVSLRQCLGAAPSELRISAPRGVRASGHRARQLANAAPQDLDADARQDEGRQPQHDADARRADQRVDAGYRRRADVCRAAESSAAGRKPPPANAPLRRDHLPLVGPGLPAGRDSRCSGPARRRLRPAERDAGPRHAAGEGIPQNASSDTTADAQMVMKPAAIVRVVKVSLIVCSPSPLGRFGRLTIRAPARQRCEPVHNSTEIFGALAVCRRRPGAPGGTG